MATPPLTAPINQSPELSGKESCDASRSGSSNGGPLALPTIPSHVKGSHGRNLSDGGGVAWGAKETSHRRNLSDSQTAKLMPLQVIGENIIVVRRIL